VVLGVAGGAAHAVHHPSGRPVRQWKLSPTDLSSLEKWDDYTRAKQHMFQHTDTDQAPWVVVKSNDKKRGRIPVGPDAPEVHGLRRRLRNSGSHPSRPLRCCSALEYA